MEEDNKESNTPILPDNLSWMMEHRASEHVSLASFAKKFSLFDKSSTESCYEQLIRSSSIPRPRQGRLMAAFVLFKRNSSWLFWESRRRTVTVEKAAVLSMEFGYLRSKRAYKVVLSDTVESQEEGAIRNDGGDKDKEKMICLYRIAIVSRYFRFCSLGRRIERCLINARLLTRHAIGGY